MWELQDATVIGCTDCVSYRMQLWLHVLNVGVTGCKCDWMYWMWELQDATVTGCTECGSYKMQFLLDVLNAGVARCYCDWMYWMWELQDATVTGCNEQPALPCLDNTANDTAYRSQSVRPSVISVHCQQAARCSMYSTLVHQTSKCCFIFSRSRVAISARSPGVQDHLDNCWHITST